MHFSIENDAVHATSGDTRERRSKVESSRQRFTVVAANAPKTKLLPLMCRRLPVFLDRPPTKGFNFFSYNSALRGSSAKFSLVNSGGLLSITAHLLILIAALKSWFTNFIRFLLLIVLPDAPSPETFAFLPICSSVSAPYFCISSGLLWHFFIPIL